jgi:hypothetical protein
VPLSQSNPKIIKGSDFSTSCVCSFTPSPPLFQVARTSVQTLKISVKVLTDTNTDTFSLTEESLNYRHNSPGGSGCS